MNPQIWLQHYDPLGNPLLSTLIAALPVSLLLICIGWLRVPIHRAALIGLIVALLVATLAYGMPIRQAGLTTLYGAGFGLFPIGWIIINVLFLYQITVEKGQFRVLRDSLARIAPDARVQLILIAFAFGAFIEGMAGFGAPVAITGAILIQLGFRPLHASGLALIANTAPVAFGSLGIPLTTLHQVTGLDLQKLSSMVGRQLPPFSLMVPFWVVFAFVGWRKMWEVWPAALTAGLSFAVPQFLVSNFHGPYLVDLVSGGCSIAATASLLRFWRPKHPMILQPPAESEPVKESGAAPHGTGQSTLLAWMPWILLSVFILAWGLPDVQETLRNWTPWKIRLEGLHGLVQRTPPVAPPGAKPESAELNVSLLPATGTAILLAALVSGLLLKCSPRELWRLWTTTVWQARFSLFTIAAMLALGNVTKFSGADATLGLQLARTGYWYPFFGTLLGWLGVALTGSDTASNVLFGSLQKISAEQTGLSPYLMGAANSSGGVMGKMVDAQSIVVASTATRFYGREGEILRFVLVHSLVLASLVGVWVFLLAQVPPFTSWVVPS